MSRITLFREKYSPQFLRNIDLFFFHPLHLKPMLIFVESQYRIAYIHICFSYHELVFDSKECTSEFTTPAVI